MSVKSPATFAAQVLLPALALGLALSLGVNAVLLVTRPQSVTPVSSPSPAPVVQPVEALPPGGFGTVGHGMPRLSQRVDGIPAGVYRYDLPKGMLPALPQSLTLYRDQGVAADTAPFETILSSMRLPLNYSQLRLLPDNVTFGTADKMFSILVNVRDRTLEVTRLERTAEDVGAQPVTPLSDERMIAAAEDMARELGIDTSALGTPTIIKIYRALQAGSKDIVLAPGIEEVRWPLLFSGYPVVDQVGRPVSALSVFVGHRSQQGVALNMHVLSPELLSSSDYPVADATLVAGLALDGGMAPIDGDEKGRVVPVTYQSAQLAYMLPAYDPERPMYVAPVLVLTSDIQRTCKAGQPCVPWTWTTYVPLLHPDHYAWIPGQHSSSASAMTPASSAAMSSRAASSAAAVSSAKPVSSSSSSAKSVLSSSAKPASSSAPGNPMDGLQILR